MDRLIFICKFLRIYKCRSLKKTKNCAEWWKRKDGVEEVEEAGWSTSTYSGEVPEEMRWKGRDMNS
jgi:hypothetical protein